MRWLNILYIWGQPQWGRPGISTNNGLSTITFSIAFSTVYVISGNSSSYDEIYDPDPCVAFQLVNTKCLWRCGESEGVVYSTAIGI